MAYLFVCHSLIYPSPSCHFSSPAPSFCTSLSFDPYDLFMISLYLFLCLIPLHSLSKSSSYSSLSFIYLSYFRSLSFCVSLSLSLHCILLLLLIADLSHTFLALHPHLSWFSFHFLLRLFFHSNFSSSLTLFSFLLHTQSLIFV